MDFPELIPEEVNLKKYSLGEPQKSGAMTVLPVFGPKRNGNFTSPIKGLKLSKVKGYGNLELTNPSDSGVAIVPLHIGYIQDGAQNHALCRSIFLAAGQTFMFEDACCVQQAQGGYLKEQDQWFFILPLELRQDALKLRRIKNFRKLWDAISKLNALYGLPARGHLEQITGGFRPYLNQFRNRFELMPEQTGAFFFIGNKLAGFEIAPNPEYFSEVWLPLVCFCYGPAARYEEQKINISAVEAVPFPAKNLSELRKELDKERQKVKDNLMAVLNSAPEEKFSCEEEERYLELRLSTVMGKNFSGQYVSDEDNDLIYASISASGKYIYA